MIQKGPFKGDFQMPKSQVGVMAKGRRAEARKGRRAVGDLFENPDLLAHRYVERDCRIDPVVQWSTGPVVHRSSGPVVQWSMH
jgi:hypothetical protein